jgi:hypothetical protein
VLHGRRTPCRFQIGNRAGSMIFEWIKTVRVRAYRGL